MTSTTTGAAAGIAGPYHGRRCLRCETEIASTLLACPVCHALVHADALRSLAVAASAAEHADDLSGALAAWRTAADLLPRSTRQYATISDHIRDLSRRLDSPHTSRAPRFSSGRLRDLLWGTVSRGGRVIAAQTTLLLTGLTKPATLISLLVFLALYWQVWAWQLALGFVASIYVHEMGHVSALSRYGIKASAPVFLPGLGAIVRLKQTPATPREDARIGLAGPLWGLGAGVAAYGAFLISHVRVWAVVAQIGGFINLFNLIPVWQLDGARGCRALSRRQRWVVVAVATASCLAAWRAHTDVLGRPLLPIVLILLGLGVAWQAVRIPAPSEPDQQSLFMFCGLVGALTWLGGR